MLIPRALTSKFDSNQGHIFTDMLVSKYLDIRLLKSRNITAITSDKDKKLEVTNSDKTLPVTSNITVKGAVVSTVMKTFDVSYLCPDCKSNVEPDVSSMIVWQYVMSAASYFDQIIARLKTMSGLPLWKTIKCERYLMRRRVSQTSICISFPKSSCPQI